MHNEGIEELFQPKHETRLFFFGVCWKTTKEPGVEMPPKITERIIAYQVLD